MAKIGLLFQNSDDYYIELGNAVDNHEIHLYAKDLTENFPEIQDEYVKKLEEDGVTWHRHINQMPRDAAVYFSDVTILSSYEIPLLNLFGSEEELAKNKENVYLISHFQDVRKEAREQGYNATDYEGIAKVVAQLEDEGVEA